METKKSFEDTLKLTRTSLLLSGIRIYDKEFSASIEKLLCYIFYINLLFVYFDVFGEVCWLVEGIYVGKNILELSLIAPCGTISMLATAKSTLIFVHQGIVLKVVKKLQNIHPKDNAQALNKEEKDILNDSIKILTFVILLLYGVSVVVIVAFSLMPAASMVYDYYSTGEIEYKYPYLVKYWFDPFTKEWWPFLYLHQIWSSMYFYIYIS